MTKLFATTALIAATIIAAPAAANTIQLSYDGEGVKVKNDSVGYDFFNLNEYGPRVEFAKVPFDDSDEAANIPSSFRADGRDDFQVTTSQAVRDKEGNVIEKGFGRIELLENSLNPFVDAVRVFNENDMYAQTFPMQVFPFEGITQRGSFAYVDGDLATFGAGGNDGNLVDGRFDYDSSVAELYGPKAKPNLLTGDNDTAILGFRIDVILEPYEDMYVSMYEGEGMYCDVPFLLDQENDEIFDCGPQEEILASYFGFVEVKRGSVTPGTLGVNTIIGAAAVVPTVPLPAPIMMLGAGLAGLGALRRRNKS